jgi:hypothetical protein
MLDSGKYLPTFTMLAEEIFFGLWSKPNFREKTTNEEIKEWPVYGWNYDVLIGGLYPDQKAEWEYGLAGYTLELAFPITLANKMMKRVRHLFDDKLKKGIVMTATYRSGINIKCELQSKGWTERDIDKRQLAKLTLTSSASSRTTRATAPTGPRGLSCSTSPRSGPPLTTTSGSASSYVSDEDYIRERVLRWGHFQYHKVANALIDKFPCRPHWTKNTREVFTRSVKNLDPDVSILARLEMTLLTDYTQHLRRFQAVREQFDPQGIYRSVIRNILGLY